MLDQNKHLHTDLKKFTFKDFCGFYYTATSGWEWARVRGCALLHCMDEPCGVRSKTCDVRNWIYQGKKLFSYPLFWIWQLSLVLAS
jgi:hypothetical protein